VYAPAAPDRAARRLVMAHALADLTFAFLLLALAAAGQPQPQRSLENNRVPGVCVSGGVALQWRGSLPVQLRGQFAAGAVA
jgi:hypothetical protein